MQDLQAAQIAELQGKLDKLESQQGPTQYESEEIFPVSQLLE